MDILAFVHIIVAVALIGLVLIQDSKGGAMGVFGGGASNTVFGSSGGTNFLVKLTRVIAVVFALTSITLAYMATPDKDGSVTDKMDMSVPAAEQPVDAAAPAEAPAQEAPADADKK